MYLLCLIHFSTVLRFSTLLVTPYHNIFFNSLLNSPEQLDKVLYCAVVMLVLFILKLINILLNLDESGRGLHVEICKPK